MVAITSRTKGKRVSLGKESDIVRVKYQLRTLGLIYSFFFNCGKIYINVSS